MLNKTLKAVNNDYNQEDFENLIEMFRRYEQFVLKVENDMYMLREPSDLGEIARHHARFVLYSDYFATNLVDYAVGISERLVHFFAITDGFTRPPLKMNDLQAPPVGTEGTVVGVDGIGSLIMLWDNGSGLNVLYGVDEVEKI